RREPQSSGPEVNPVVACDLEQSPAFLEERRWNLVRLFPIVVSGTARKEPRVECRTNDKRYVLHTGCRKDLVQSVLVVDQRVLRGQKTYIRVGHFKQPHDWLRSI